MEKYKKRRRLDNHNFFWRVNRVWSSSTGPGARLLSLTLIALKDPWLVQNLIRTVSKSSPMYIREFWSAHGGESPRNWRRTVVRLPCWGAQDAAERRCSRPLVNQGKLIANQPWTLPHVFAGKTCEYVCVCVFHSHSHILGSSRHVRVPITLLFFYFTNLRRQDNLCNNRFFSVISHIYLIWEFNRKI